MSAGAKRRAWLGLAVVAGLAIGGWLFWRPLWNAEARLVKVRLG